MAEAWYGEPRDDRGQWIKLYHGTNYPFQPGDYIEPGHSTNYPGAYDGEEEEALTRVHVTPVVANAWQHADNAVHEHGKAGKPAGRQHVFEVEPVGQVEWGTEAFPEDFESDEEMFAIGDRLSTSPFRVVREVPYKGEDLPFTHRIAETSNSTITGQIDMAFDPAEPRDKAGKWYHGTSDLHMPGDVIDPGIAHRANFDPEHSDPKSVYFSGSVKAALHYAERDKGGLGTPHVYEVEPLGEHQPIAPGVDQHKTKSPIRIIREVGTADLSASGHCPNCGCPRPDSITAQIELAGHFNPAEPRGPGGKWVTMKISDLLPHVRGMAEGDSPHIDQLAADMRANGFQRDRLDSGGSPVTMVITDKGEHYIMTGNHRVAAAHRAGLRTIPVLVRDYRHQADLSSQIELGYNPAELRGPGGEWASGVHHESVQHMLAHYRPTDFDTWPEVRGNLDWNHPKWKAFVADIRKNGVRRPILIDYEQDPPRVMNGHTRLLAAEKAGLKTVPTRQHEGFMDPDDPDPYGNVNVPDEDFFSQRQTELSGDDHVMADTSPAL